MSLEVYKQDLARIRVLDSVESPKSTNQDIDSLLKVLFDTQSGTPDGDSYFKYIIKLLNQTRAFHQSQVESTRNLSANATHKENKLSFEQRRLLATKANLTKIINLLNDNIQSNCQT